MKATAWFIVSVLCAFMCFVGLVEAFKAHEAATKPFDPFFYEVAWGHRLTPGELHAAKSNWEEGNREMKRKDNWGGLLFIGWLFGLGARGSWRRFNAARKASKADAK